jgi:hypothetical protein
MLLTGTAAVGLGVFQFVWRTVFEGWYFVAIRDGFRPRAWNGLVFVRYASDLVVPLIPVAAAWTLLLPALRRRSPRTARWRRVWGQPGMAACLAALVGWGWGLLAFGIAARLNGSLTVTKAIPSDVWLQKFFADEALMYPGAAVAAAWACLAFGGRWRRSADALDLLGRLVGASWLLIGLIWTLREYAGYL